MGRNVCIPRIKYTIYPNLFIILVAGSARCKKSTAIGIGENIIREIENTPTIIAQRTTTEAMIQSLEQGWLRKKECKGLICASELSVFMGMDATKTGIIPTLTDLYDSPSQWIYHTRSRGEEVLKNVTITIIAGTTKSWLKSVIPADAIGGGFTSRIIFIYQTKPKKPVLFHEETEEEKRLREDLIFDLNLISSIKGNVNFTKEAREMAEEWYQAEWEKERDGKLNGYFARKHDIMFKVATILSLAERDDLVITHHHIHEALSILERNEEKLGEIMAAVETTPVGGVAEKIYEIVKRSGPISHSELLRRSWRFATAQDVAIHLRSLIDGDEIEEFFDKDGKTRKYVIKGRR